MPRPKGSKNRKNRPVEVLKEGPSVSDYDAKIEDAEKKIAELSEQLKGQKALLKQYQKEKAEAEAAEAQRKAEEDKKKVLEALEKSGRSVEEVLEFLAKEE